LNAAATAAPVLYTSAPPVTLELKPAPRLFQLFVRTPGAPASELESIGFRGATAAPFQSHKLTEIILAIETDASHASTAPVIMIFFILFSFLFFVSAAGTRRTALLFCNYLGIYNI
jgi:hypothetical protein